MRECRATRLNSDGVGVVGIVRFACQYHCEKACPGPERSTAARNGLKCILVVRLTDGIDLSADADRR
jgi:hypothetical protein